MKKAGYEWDAKNKELKKIIDKEQIKKNLQDNGFRRMFEQEFAWSEEDNEHLERILKELENQRQRPINNPYLDKIESDYNWLKSLKDRVRPTIAWNENDEVALESAATNYAQDKYLPVQMAIAFKAGAEWMLRRITTSSPAGQAPT